MASASDMGALSPSYWNVSPLMTTLGTASPAFCFRGDVAQRLLEPGAYRSPAVLARAGEPARPDLLPVPVPAVAPERMLEDAAVQAADPAPARAPSRGGDRQNCIAARIASGDFDIEILFERCGVSVG